MIAVRSVGKWSCDLQFDITVEELRKRSLFVACPMYGGNCAGLFTKSMCDLTALCTKYGIQITFFALFNESLITRARAYCTDEFMRSGYTHMMFIDSDIGFDPNDVIALLAMASDESEYDVIGGPYPKKCISWEKIKLAVDKGAADQNPNALENYVGDFVFNPVINEKTLKEGIPLAEPAEVMELGTGFMMIKRSTIEKFIAAYPEKMYRPDHVRTENFDGSREICMVFDCMIDPETKRYLSEDYMFCQYVRKMGGKVWLAPWMSLKHVGSYIFGGSLAAMAQIGANATAGDDANPNLRKKSKNTKKR